MSQHASLSIINGLHALIIRQCAGLHPSYLPLSTQRFTNSQRMQKNVPKTPSRIFSVAILAGCFQYVASGLLGISFVYLVFSPAKSFSLYFWFPRQITIVVLSNCCTVYFVADFCGFKVMVKSHSKLKKRLNFSQCQDGQGAWMTTPCMSHSWALHSTGNTTVSTILLQLKGKSYVIITLY